MRYLGTANFRVTYIHIYVSEGYPININPRIHSAVIVDTILFATSAREIRGVRATYAELEETREINPLRLDAYPSPSRFLR